MLEIQDWEWDDGNLDELARHGLDDETVYQVWEDDPRARRNKRKRAATYQMIGGDNGGSIWTICIVEKPGLRGTWRAVTGCAAEPEEQNWYWNSIGGKK